METKKCSEFGIIIGEDRAVYEIQDLLLKTVLPEFKKPMFFYNGVENLDNSLPVKEIFKNGDVVTAYYGAIPSLESQPLAGGNEKNIQIMCERDVKLTLRTRWRGLEMHVSNQKIRAIDFKNYDKEIEIYWYLYNTYMFFLLKFYFSCRDTGRKNDVLNQKIFQGNKYQLDKVFLLIENSFLAFEYLLLNKIFYEIKFSKSGKKPSGVPY